MPTVSNKARAQFELRRLKIATVDEPTAGDEEFASPKKRRKIHDVEDHGHLVDSPTFSDDGTVTLDRGAANLTQGSLPSENNAVKVVRLAWVQNSLSAGKVLDHGDYLVHEAVRKPKDEGQKSIKMVPPPSAEDLLRRAQKMAGSSSQTTVRRHFRDKDGIKHIKLPPLLPQSTTEENVLSRLPPIPEYLRTTYSCQRSTFVHPPNEAFIEKLKEVRELRKMTGDEIGVRAYSSAIASLSAYPYKLQSAIGLSSLRPRIRGERR